ncbi:hypothetical protein [Tropicimonas sp. IMCC6043]|uniref:hypothetical protein n=1 Tax=Tropicimonas sp. IMCC6043 TaxID=2510645 RepID=UPI0013EAC16B|nr:hypothetical protein [Tropicimonas sp. IMCC6043]
MDATGWKRDSVAAALYTDVKNLGLGVERRDGILRLLRPDNLVITAVDISCFHSDDD